MSQALTYDRPQSTLAAAPSRYDLAVLGLRLLGIWLLLESSVWFNYLGRVIWQAAAVELRPIALMSVPFVVYLVVGLWFCFLPDGLAVRILPRNSASAGEAAIGGADLQSIAFSAIGLALIVFTLPGLVGLYLTGVQSETWMTGEELVEPLTRLIAGVILFLQGRGLSALWRRLRTPPANRAQ